MVDLCFVLYFYKNKNKRKAADSAVLHMCERQHLLSLLHYNHKITMSPPEISPREDRELALCATAPHVYVSGTQDPGSIPSTTRCHSLTSLLGFSSQKVQKLSHLLFTFLRDNGLQYICGHIGPISPLPMVGVCPPSH